MLKILVSTAFTNLRFVFFSQNSPGSRYVLCAKHGSIYSRSQKNPTAFFWLFSQTVGN